MTFPRAMLIIICILLGFVVLTNMSGCAWCQRVANAVFNTETKPEPIIVPETPKGQLWETIKGLTPNWLAIPVIAAGGVVMWYGSFKLGMAFVIFGSINLFMALATSRFGFIMALIGLIGSVAAVLSAMVAKNKALKELIFGVQDIKGGMGSHVDTQFEDRTKEILSKQTKSTKKIVAKIKTKAKLQGKM